MKEITKEVRDLMLLKLKEIKNRDEYRNFVSEYCDENGLDYWEVWQGFARDLFERADAHRIRNRYIEAVKNTFKYFPTTDLCRMEHCEVEKLKSYIVIGQVDGKWIVKKIFGVEVLVENNECRCFALRWREPMTRYDGTPYETLSLLTTFDFATIKQENHKEEENMVWGCAFHAGRKYIPTAIYYSLFDFIEMYKSFTDERFDADKLVMVDDTPEPITEQDYEQ